MDDVISRQAAIDRAVSIPMFGRDVKMVAVGEIKNLPSAQPDAIPLDWIQRYADDWEDIGYAYENPILGMLEDWREEQDDS